MSAPADTMGRTAVRRGPRPVWAVLGRGELRRLLLHPVLLGCLAFMVVVFGIDGGAGPRDAYLMTTGGLSFLLGPFTFFAANLLASRDRRHGAEEWLSSLPAARDRRTGALLLACAGPAAVSLVFALVLWAWYAAADSLVRAPSVLEVSSGALVVLGGGLLGVMVARWAPWPGAAALVMVGLVAFHLRVAERAQLLGAYVEFPRWGATPTEWAGVIDGSRAWHVGYLAGLCAMAAIGALLVDVRRKRRLFLVGVVVTACTVLAGWAQLP
ncbi:hypothetical protein [Blastococcus deserti]|uniref:ABC transporter permease n=1 Tax=Blastococcus deserti TaxID=2259033 RepID=A0ABW4XJ58_9ACTN